MKHKLLIELIGLLLLFIFCEVKAQEVKKTEAQQVAVNAFSAYSGKAAGSLNITQQIPIVSKDTTLFYVYNFEDGFVIIAADKVAEPVLAFNLTSKFDFDNMSPALTDLLEDYKHEIIQAKRAKVKSLPAISNKWANYLNPGKAASNNSGTSQVTTTTTTYIEGSYLIATNWGQNGGRINGNNIDYNNYCPVDAYGRKTLVGCGGVALAQILNYWTCRVHPQNSINYISDHDEEPLSFSIDISLASQIYNWDNMFIDQATYDNALFLYHCAAALKSDFGIYSTGSLSSNVDNALIKNFGFNGTLVSKDSYNSQIWTTILKANIDSRRPVFYLGCKTSDGKGGHGWVVDGYKDSLFHCNWGWQGFNNGFYNLSALTGSITYNYIQKAIINIYPTYNSSELVLQNTAINSGTQSKYSIKVVNSKIQNNANVILEADCTTEIFGTFEVPLGAILEII